MYDKSLLLDILDDILTATKKVRSRSKDIKSSDDFLEDEQSLILLDSICMQLIAIGQGVKDIDKLTNKKLFVNYATVPWRNIAGIRDILSHNYFNLNAETVFGILGENIDNLITILEKIKEDSNDNSTI
ncbi:MAG: DUF86 domain-containing protein [Helicobacteraceae bacterium]|nr:DUF86 domain-containing protein [Helicobacteraceae bacterium]